MENRYDVIIVGTGVAGCFAALHLPCDKKVLMITKGELEESDSFLAQGGICVLRDENDFDDFFEDTMKAGHYKNKKSSVETMINSSRDVINQLINFNVDFARENGELLYTREGAHSKPRILYHDDITGEEITKKLLTAVQKRNNITVLTKTTMIDLISSGNICCGIVLYHDDITGEEITKKLLTAVQKRNNITVLTKTTMIDLISSGNICCGIVMEKENGEIVPVYADDVILASGGLGGVYENSTNFPHLTGDALAIAKKHNVKLKDISYVQIHPTTLYSQKKGRRFLVSESVRGEGALLYDKNYERFTEELIPRDKLSQKIWKQMEKRYKLCADSSDNSLFAEKRKKIFGF